MIENSFGAFVVFGIVWAIHILIMLEMLSIARETRAQLHVAVKKFAVEFNALRQSHEDHIAGKPTSDANAQRLRRRSTDIADWVTDSGIGDGLVRKTS
jgi:hypothetical protein